MVESATDNDRDCTLCLDSLQYSIPKLNNIYINGNQVAQAYTAVELAVQAARFESRANRPPAVSSSLNFRFWLASAS